MKAGDICNRQVVWVHLDMTATEAARVMRGRHVGALLVVDAKNNAVGLITDRDLALEVLALGGDANALTMNELMSKPLICCQEADSVSAAIRTMRKHGIRRLPVLGEAQQPLGMLTLDDAVDHLGRMLGDLVGIMKSQFNRERKTRN